jgi:hypothetical protein
LLEQQSSSIMLPSSHCSLGWLTTPSPQRGIVDVEVLVDVLVLVEELDDVDVLVEVEVELEELLVLVEVDELDVLVDVEVLVLLVDVEDEVVVLVEVLVDVVVVGGGIVGVVGGRLAEIPGAMMRRPTSRPTRSTPKWTWMVENGAHTFKLRPPGRETRTRPVTKTRTVSGSTLAGSENSEAMRTLPATSIVVAPSSTSVACG